MKHLFASVFRKLNIAWLVLRRKTFIYRKITYSHHQVTFSQEGEDGVLRRLFEHKYNGFYVDVGAHHPQRFSNTYFFYLRGWNGINIDPLPGSKARFDALRPRDITLEVGVSSVPGFLHYYQFDEPALNTFDPVVAQKHSRHYRLASESEISVAPLQDILSQYLPSGTSIDFLSIDVEGHDLHVLQSNDWSRFRPKFVLAESLKQESLQDVLQSEINRFMASVDYILFAKTVNTLFFTDSKHEHTRS